MTESEKRESFHHQRVASRAAIVAAGPIANFILAIVIFTAVFMVYGKQSTTARVDAIQAGQRGCRRPASSPATSWSTSTGARSRISPTCSASSASMPVRRCRSPSSARGNRVVLKATPALREIKDNFGNTHRLGVLGISRSNAPDEIRTEKVGPVDALILGVDKTWFVVEQTMSYLGRMIAGRESADQLGGPIRIAQVSGQVATLGFGPILDLAAVLSVSIGLLNLFPIPLLDGGHLLFYLIEAVRGRPLSEKAQEMGFRIGLAFVLMLMVFATFNDIMHLWTS